MKRASVFAVWERFQRADGRIELTRLWELYPRCGDGERSFHLTREAALRAAGELGFAVTEAA
jgi:hypothetical protein